MTTLDPSSRRPDGSIKEQGKVRHKVKAPKKAHVGAKALNSSQNPENAEDIKGKRKVHFVEGSEPKANGSNAQQVGKGFFGGIKSVMGAAGNKAAAYAANLISDSYRKEDEAFLRALTGTSKVGNLIDQVAPKLPIALQTVLPNALQEFVRKEKDSAEKISEALCLHVLANLAASMYPEQAQAYYSGLEIPKEQTVSLDDFAEKACLHIINLLGKDLDGIDAAVVDGAEVTPELFEPLAQKLLDLILPKNKEGYWARLFTWGEKKIASHFIKDFSSFLMKAYLPLANWLSGEEADEESLRPKVDFDAVKSDAEQFALYLANCLANHFKEQDNQLLKDLTGQEDIQKIIQRISPSVSNMIIGIIPLDLSKLAKENPEAVKNISEAFMLRIINDIAEEVFKKEIAEGTQVPVDQFVKRLTIGFVGIFREEFEGIDQRIEAGAEVTDELFLPLAGRLMKLVLPKDPLIENFLARRKDKLSEPIAARLREVYECIAYRNDTEDYKQRLREVLWDPAAIAAKHPNLKGIPERPTKDYCVTFGIEPLIDQLFNLCHNVTALGKGKVGEIFSDPDVIVKQAKALAGPEASFAELIQDVARGTSDIIQSDDEDLSWMTGNIQNVLQLTLFKGLVHLLEKVPPADRNSPEEIFTSALEILLDLANKEFPDIRRVVELVSDPDSDEYIEDEELREKAIQEAMKPFLSELITILYEDDLDYDLLVEIANEEFPDIRRAIELISDPDSDDYIEDDELREKAVRKILEPSLDELIAILREIEPEAVGMRLEDHLPVPEWAKKLCADKIRASLPAVLSPIFKATTSWIDAKKKNRDRLGILYATKEVNDDGEEVLRPNKRPAEACRMIGALTAQAIPWSMQEFHDTAGDYVVENFGKLFAEPGEAAPSPEELSQIKRIISGTLLAFAENDSPAMDNLLKFAEEFSESALLRVFADLSVKFKELEDKADDEKHEKPLVEAVVILLQEVQEHLELIADVNSNLRRFRQGKVTHEKMLQEFDKAGRLHPALKDGSLEERALFFERFTKTVFDFVEIDEEAELPIPEFLKGPLWETFEKQLMPLLLLTLFQKASSPHNLNMILITIFKQINEASGQIDLSLTEEELEAMKYKDQTQEELEEVCGKLVQALVRMQPSALTRWLLANKKIRALAGEAMGQPLRERLENTTILGLIDEMIVGIMPVLHPGTWDEDGTYICERVAINEDGEEVRQVIAEPEFDHLLPVTPEEKEDFEIRAAEEKADAEKEVVEQISGGLENQTKYIFLGLFRKLWKVIHKYIDLGIDHIFGRYSPAIKAGVNKVLDVLGNYLLGPILYAVTWPVFYIVRRLLRFYFVYQSEMRAGDVQHPIHANAAYRALDKLFATFLHPEILEQLRESEIGKRNMAIGNIKEMISDAIEFLDELDNKKLSAGIEKLKELEEKADEEDANPYRLNYDFMWHLQKLAKKDAAVSDYLDELRNASRSSSPKGTPREHTEDSHTAESSDGEFSDPLSDE